MVDAGYGEAAIPILLKAKELYVSFKKSPDLPVLPTTICNLSVIAKLTGCFLSSFSSGFPGR